MYASRSKDEHFVGKRCTLRVQKMSTSWGKDVRFAYKKWVPTAGGREKMSTDCCRGESFHFVGIATLRSASRSKNVHSAGAPCSKDERLELTTILFGEKCGFNC